MRRFIAFSPIDYRESGGARALYGLIRALRRYGYEAFLFPFEKMPLSFQNMMIDGCPVISKSDLDLKNDIFIYPEVVQGNPLGAHHCVRWILFTPGVHSADFTNTWTETDLVMHWSGFIGHGNQKANIQNHQILNLLELNPDWLIKNQQQSEGDLCIIRKGKKLYKNAPEEVKKKIERFCSHEVKCLDQICKSSEDYIYFYRRSRRLFSYDPYTFHIQLAVLSGCEVVVFPIPGVAKAQWLESLLHPDCLPVYKGKKFLPGTAYVHPDDPSYAHEMAIARNSKHLLWPLLRLWSKEGEKTVLNFAKKAQMYFSSSQ